MLSDLLDPIFGSDNSKTDKKAEDSLKKIIDSYNGISAPELSSPDIVPYQNVSNLGPSDSLSYDLGDPRVTSASTVGDSAFNDIESDPRLKDSQNSALAALEAISKNGGLTAQDKANLAQIQSETSQADRGRREAILQNMGARGMGGSGAELLAQLDSSQAASDRSSQAGLDVAGMSEQRALDSLIQSGNLAGSMRNQDFGEKAQKANANDIIAKFNAGNTQQANLANSNAANNFALSQAEGKLGADKFNIGNNIQNSQNAQNISNLNTAAANTQAQNKASLPQQNFQNEMAIASGKSAAGTPAVGYYQGLGDRNAKKDAEYLSALIKGGAAVAAA